jgi:hypothetical protein
LLERKVAMEKTQASAEESCRINAAANPSLSAKMHADDALDVFENVAAQLGRPDLIQPALDVVRSRIFQPKLLQSR